MATIEETIWVHNDAELHNSVQTLLAQGGVVQYQGEGSVILHVKRKLNVVLLVVLLLLCIVPGLAYLIWHVTANANQTVTVKVGQPSNVGGYHPENEPGAAPMPAPGGVQDAVGPPESLPRGDADPWMVPPQAAPGMGVQDAVQPSPAPPAVPPPATGL